MSERWARWILTAYRYGGAAVYPVIGTYVGWRAAKGKEDHARRRERYGFTDVPRPHGPLVWMHAASVGETSAVIPMVDYLARHGLTIVLTTGTVTSARVVEQRLRDTVIHQYVPLDLKPAVSRFLDHWQPDLAVIAESEIWPMTILELGARRVPQVLINARLSDRSFAAWKKRAYLAEALMENLAHVVAQSDVDGQRYRDLGARPVTVSGNLKADTVPPPANWDDLAALESQIGKRPVWAAISTHPGEDVIAAEVHEKLKRKYPGILSIIVPRHPDRAEAISGMLDARGLSVVRRTARAPLTEATDILLGDTIGEMGLYLRLTEIAFVGKSLAGEGGQNPLEPAVLGAAVLSGKDVQNFRESYERLIANGGARIVRDGEMLAGAVSFLLSNEQVRRAMISNAVATVSEMGGALQRTIEAIDSYIRPLIVKAQLDNVDGDRRARERRQSGWGPKDFNKPSRRIGDRRLG
jgi:3-deoxy-D-manno-octulosonic-acid transferase